MSSSPFALSHLSVSRKGLEGEAQSNTRMQCPTSDRQSVFSLFKRALLRADGMQPYVSDHRGANRQQWPGGGVRACIQKFKRQVSL